MSKQPHGHSGHESPKGERFILSGILLAGIALVAALFSPFILEMMGSRRASSAPSFSEDAANLAADQTTVDRPLGAARLRVPRAWRPIYDHFGGVRLDHSKEEVEQKYPLHLTGKPDAVPLIYESTNVSQAVKFHAEFYDNKLKEFTVVYGPFRDSAEALVQQLYQGLGEGPRYRISDADAGTRVGLQDPDLVKFLSSFQHAKALTWGDSSNRLEATIYSAVTVSNQPVTALAVRVAAVTWLEDYQRKAAAETAIRLREKKKKASDSSSSASDRESGGPSEP